ncbi:MAG TPA: bifunctional transaldolase/phosoglucose isomerase [Thermoleophilaceae bacterium]|nr:bifunctional transaldolase/phosoglucose isomerase [Thermoleophilaceae bacterium]
MATAAQTNERLAALLEAGTSPWLDQIRRSLIEQGELERLVREESLRGVTSNPAIFEKAILGSDDYDEDIERLAGEGLDANDIYLTLAVKDVQMACDVMRPVWEEAGGADGFVSLEVEPGVAFDTDATLRQAHELWERVDRPNVLIKIPATDEGMPAIEEAIASGINVNVTLLFKVEAYEKVTERYIRGLERRHDSGEPLDVHSVASFFVSRVDSEVDKRLEKLGREDLKGRAALANARDAYMSYKRIFEGERFASLREAGAPVQRPLWASTGVKNPEYPETMYVDELVAPNTVNTMPMATLNAAAEKAEIKGATADQDPAEDLKALEEAGIDMADVTDKLLKDGVAAFVTPFEKLLAGVESVKEAVVTGRPATIDSVLPDELEPPIARRAQLAVEENVARRVWRKDETLWGGPGPEIGNRLGWLTISEPMLENAGDLGAFAEEVKAEGYTDAALLGMGGSSLGPEVIRRSFGDAGGLRLHVLDSTDPGAVHELESRIPLDKTIFIVSSKSGGTVETLSHMKHFYERTGGRGEQFVAVTDPGSGLVDEASERGFRRVFQNDPNIGGRYSVLSYFGLVPAALAGVDVEALLESSREAEENCNSYDSTSSNSGLWMGLTMGELALHGRDKLTFVVDEPISGFGLWVEQLIAESTGKQGKGILPVADEPLGDPEAYGDDRVVVHLANSESPDEHNAAKVDALAKAGQAVIRLSSRGNPEDLGRIFFFAEFATAVAGWALGINAFDQPNVQEAKDKTNEVLNASQPPQLSEAGDEELRALLGRAAPPHYVAIMGYVQPSSEFDEAVRELRAAIRDATKATTTFGYGPRYLHSTGQLHKGGAPNGLFLQLIHDGDQDVDIPDADFTFGELKNAQATGDLQTLRDHGLPAERVRLEGNAVKALRELTERVRGLLG